MTLAITARLARALEQAIPIYRVRRQPESSDAEDAAAPPPTTNGVGIRKLVLTAASWSMGGYAAGQVLRIAGNLLLTRVLAPDLFGLAAVATMVSVLVALLSDIGLHQAVIRSPKGELQRFLDTAWTIQIVRGFLIWFVSILIGFGIGYIASRGWVAAHSVYANPQLPLIIIGSGLGFAISGFQSTNYISHQRNLGLSRLTKIELICQAVGIVTAVVLAWLTQSVWAVVISSLVSSLLGAILSHTWIPGPRNSFRMNREDAREIFLFGRWIMFSSFFTVFSANGDRILLGNWASSTTFGLYGLALNLVGMIEGIGGRLYGAVGTPTLSKIARERPERLRSAYLRLRAPFDIFYIGCAGLLFGCGQTIIDILYDHRYAAAGSMLQILSFSLLMARFGIMTSVYIAVGEPRNVGILNCVKAGLLFTVVPLCYWLFDFQGALWAIALYTLPTVPLILFFNMRHKLNNLMFEIGVLLVWPVGYAAGLMISKVAGHLFAAVM
ncbi:oligosaccharide flippase family protein [Rhizobium sp. S96]|uniref:oligosaccharide flippase family protein n=1 Tax=Rhizobium sp. S96 TaxID=3055140 RepID=UPI0025AB4978|nr:oligosaccharide flippase family protein [Rhizobium sp. S96]MDM9620628.1 oligosaccharide flippase family protein [Rhizobium sp. S96]